MSDNVVFNRTEYSVTKANAYTNNTFSLAETEKSILNTLYNSFNYLKDLQHSYMRIYRFNLDESDLYINDNWDVSITLDKDFIDSPLRRKYRESMYYNKYLSLGDVLAAPDIFVFTPVVLIDGKLIYTFTIKTALDGHTDISFPHITRRNTFMSSGHKIEVVFMRDLFMSSFVINRTVITDNGGIIPTNANDRKFPANMTAFISIKKNISGGNPVIEGTNLFVASTTENGNLKIDLTNESIVGALGEYESIEVAVLIPKYIHSTGKHKQIQTRIDNKKKSSIIVVEPDSNDHYSMTVPPENIFIFKVNKKTGEYSYENNREVILHYPKIYEIISDDIDERKYEYEVFYFYHEDERYFRYRDKFKYIYKFISDKLNKSLEDTINTLLYSKYEKDEKLQEYFLNIFDYDDQVYLYSDGDFFDSEFFNYDPYKSYNMDYKINKMNEYIEKDPWVLRDYARALSVPSSTYYLSLNDIRDILSSRVRKGTKNEAARDIDVIEFIEDHYVFLFRNEWGESLDLRFFIDGLFCPNPIHIHAGIMDYIYFPCSVINKSSYIEVERFYTYVMSEKIFIPDRRSTTMKIDHVGNQVEYKQNSGELYITPTDSFKETHGGYKQILITNKESNIETGVIEFKYDENIAPTLNDLYITDLKGEKVDRSKFKIYTLVDQEEYDISDYMTELSTRLSLILDDSFEYGKTLDEVYISIDEEFNPESDNSGSITLEDERLYDDDGSRLPLKYMILRKIKIIARNPEDAGEYLIKINKCPKVFNTVIKNTRTPEIPIDYYYDTANDKKSYIRTFVNGKMVPLKFNISDNTGTLCVVPRCKTVPGDIVTLDVTPFSYELVYETEKVPDNFVIDLSGIIDKPFDTNYFDVYLNGRKLYSENVQAITPTMIKLFNVHSQHHLYIYQKDRDYEYYGYRAKITLPLHEFLNSQIISDEEKEKIMDNIIYDFHGDVNPGENKETDWECMYDYTGETENEYDFYYDIILPQFTAKPNSLLLNHEFIKSVYPHVYNAYSCGNTKTEDGKDIVDRIVLRPNKDYNANRLLILGKKCDGIIVKKG